MKLNEKETQLLTELKNQEDICIKKYDFYAQNAKSDDLVRLFNQLKGREEVHKEMITKMLDGKVPELKSKAPVAVEYEPTEYKKYDKASREFDNFLCTDSIATEKYVATDYNNDLFYFVSTDLRNLLNAIMTDEQNHAEMIYKYKSANKMAC